MTDNAVDNVNYDARCFEEAVHFFHTSYRAPLIRDRAAKRFGRLRRQGKVVESAESIKRWEKCRKEKLTIDDPYCLWSLKK